MKAEYINPFLKSLSNAFSTMLSCELQRGPLQLRDGSTPHHEISGIIGLSGKAVGMVVLSFSESVALKATSAMLMVEATEINADVIDAVGELANVVAGAAKAQLEEFQLSISLPTVITGRNHEIRFPSDVHPICVPCQTEWGPVALEVGLTMAPEPAHA